MNTLKKYLCDYGLYIILGACVLRFAITFLVGGAYRDEELVLSATIIGLVIIVIYVHWEAKKKR